MESIGILQEEEGWDILGSVWTMVVTGIHQEEEGWDSLGRVWRMESIF